MKKYILFVSVFLLIFGLSLTPNKVSAQSVSCDIADTPATLRLGMRNDYVRCLQETLNSLGYTVSSSGFGSIGNETTFFGPSTFQALKRFQSAYSLVPDGIFGPQTRYMLSDAFNNSGNGDVVNNTNTNQGNQTYPEEDNEIICPNGRTLTSNCTKFPTAVVPVEDDGDNTIVVPIQDTNKIKVVSPSRGERLTQGQNYYISWKDSTYDAGTAPAVMVGYDIYLIGFNNCPATHTDEVCTSLYSTQNTIAKNVVFPASNFSGNYLWTVGKVLEGNQISDGGNYKVMVCKTGDSTSCDYSDQSFTIISPSSAPLVSNITGPQTLEIGQNGKWTIYANDPSGGYLTYSANWGDGLGYASSSASNAPASSTSQSAVFLHNYTIAGTYSPTFTVTNSAGKSTQVSMSVKVGGNSDPVVTPPVAGVLKINDVVQPASIYDGVSARFNLTATGVADEDLFWDVNWGDGTTDRNYVTCYQETNTNTRKNWEHSFSHVYSIPGYFNITFTVNDCNVTNISERKSDSKMVRVQVLDSNPPPGQAAPVLGTINKPTTITAGQSASFTFNASDVNNDDLAWKIYWGDGTNTTTLTFGDSNTTSTGNFHCSTAGKNKQNWTHNVNKIWQKPGTYTVRVDAYDCQNGAASTTFTVDVLSTAGFLPGSGDVNQDGSVTCADYDMILKYELGAITLTDAQKKAGDVSADGNVTAYDASLLAQQKNLSCAPDPDPDPTPESDPTPDPDPSTVPFPTTPATIRVWQPIYKSTVVLNSNGSVNLPFNWESNIGIRDPRAYLFPYPVTTNFASPFATLRLNTNTDNAIYSGSGSLFTPTKKITDGQYWIVVCDRDGVASGPFDIGCSWSYAFNLLNTETPEITLTSPQEAGYLGYQGFAGINWSTKGVTACARTGGSNSWANTNSPLSGSMTVGPLTQNTSYTITCSSASGVSVTKTLTIKVRDTASNNKPVITAINIPSSITAGQPTTFSMSATDLDNDDLYWRILWGDDGVNESNRCLIVDGVSKRMLDGVITDNDQNRVDWNYSFTHTYSKAGTYTATILVFDCNDGLATTNRTVSVTGSSAFNSISGSSLVASGLSSVTENTKTTNTPSSSVCEFSRTLSMGMRGDDISCLQKLLKDKGFEVAGTESGFTTYFGPGTYNALRNFQASMGLVADGVFGPNTRAQLK